MPDVSGPFDGATFAQAPYYRDRGYLEPSGVQGPPATTAAGGDLGLTAAGFALTMALGRAHVRGAAYERTGTAWTNTVAANTSAAGPRNDLLVLRRDLTAKTVTPTYLSGTAAATPTDPALTQVENGQWDMPLFRVQAPPSSGTPLVITDLRRWIDPNTAQLVPASIPYPGMAGQQAVAGYATPKLMIANGRVIGSSVLQDTLARAANAIIGFLPAGYRPLNAVQPLTIGGTTAAAVTGLYRVDVQLNGEIWIVPAVPANTYYFLDTFSFPLNN